MEKEELLKKINKEMKRYINESTFISMKCRNKIIKILGEEFGVDLPLENFKTIDITILEDGDIMMRDIKYEVNSKMSSTEIEEAYHNFCIRADDILKRREINYYTMNDKNNYINLLIVLIFIVVFIVLGIYTFKSFIYGNYFNSIWLIAFVSSFLVPRVRDRFTQAFNFIKKKFKK